MRGGVVAELLLEEVRAALDRQPALRDGQVRLDSLRSASMRPGQSSSLAKISALKLSAPLCERS